MNRDATRKFVSDDIDNLRQKVEYNESLHLLEAAKHSRNLAANPDLAHTTTSSDGDQPIS